MRKRQSGFSLLETMASLLVLLAVGGIVMTGMTQLIKTQGTIGNRTDMHTSVRSATELLEQEIGQAGSVSLTAPAVTVTMSAVAVGTSNFTLTTSPAGSAVTMFIGEQLLVDDGTNPEVVTVTAAAPPTYTAVFLTAHPANAALYSLGAFASGIVPPDGASAACTTAGYTAFTNGSTCSKLKLYGDLNNDGNIWYVEYNCAAGTQAAPGFLYRNPMLYTTAAAAKPANDATRILLSNILTNPNDPSNNAVSCFNYQTKADPLGNTYVVDVAVTLTVQTQNLDPQTHQFQTETKALLNVSPRNVFNAYILSTLGSNTRVQPMPASVTSLL